jgi:hypothetical protein
MPVVMLMRSEPRWAPVADNGGDAVGNRVISMN